MITAYNKDRRKKINSIDNHFRVFGIENVIISRLGLRTTKTEMYKKYGVEKIEDIDSLKFKERFEKWDTLKQEQFVIDLGGEVNKDKTTTFLNRKFNPLGTISRDIKQFEQSLNSPTARICGGQSSLATIKTVNEALEALGIE